MSASLETIEALLKEFKKNTENHLTQLNGQVKDNTSFRNKAKGGFAVLSFIGASSLFLWFLQFIGRVA